MKCNKLLITLLTIFICCNNITFAYDTYNAPEFWRHYGKQQIKSKDNKGNTIYITPNYSSYEQRNKQVSEKIVAIYDKHAPNGAYGCRYILYTPIGSYVGHHKIMQASPNGYGYACIWDGGEYSKTPTFPDIQSAKHYYYPQWY